MNITAQILEGLEKGVNQDHMLGELKNSMGINSDRSARILLHILETDPNKYHEKLEKEICKLETKLEREFRKYQKKMDSYTSSYSNNNEKINELQYELTELRKLL